MSTVRVKFPAKRAHARTEAATAPREARKPTVSRTARMLALAHQVERLVEAGELTGGYADAARALGLTRARLTQVMHLLLLAPEAQEQILLGRLDWTERRLRQVVREASWRQQIATLGRPAAPGSMAAP